MAGLNYNRGEVRTIAIVPKAIAWFGGVKSILDLRHLICIGKIQGRSPVLFFAKYPVERIGGSPDISYNRIIPKGIVHHIQFQIPYSEHAGKRVLKT